MFDFGSAQWSVFSTKTLSNDTEWDSMCHEAEGWGPFSLLREPDFTPCYEDTFVMTFPAIYLVVFGLARLVILSKRQTLPQNMTWNWVYFLKMATLILLLFTSIIRVALLATRIDTLIDDAQYLANVGCVATLIFAIALHHVEYTRNRISSGVLLFYWLFVAITGSIKLRTLILMDERQHDPALFGLFVINYTLSWIVFILELVNRPKSQDISLDDGFECPEETTNIFGRLTFEWMTPLMRLGYRQPLVMEDLWNLKTEDQSMVIGSQFQKYWDEEMQKPNPSLLRALVLTNGGPFFMAAIFKMLQDILQFVQPVFLRELMGWVASYATDDPEPVYRGVMISVGMFLTAVCQSMFLHQYFQRCFVTGMRVRASLVTAIYRKTLVLSNGSRQKSTVGEIVNHMSVDAQRLMDLCTYLHVVWSGPFQIVIALTLLYGTMGPSIWAGVAVLVLSIPLNTVIARRMRDAQKIQMGNKDSRVKLMNEILNGIRVIKLYAWEKPFIDRISFIRNDLELKTLKKIGVLASAQTFSWSSIPFFVSLSSFTVFVLTSSTPLTSAIAFVAISLFSLLQFPLSVFPNVISATIDASVSLFRIENYLLMDEIDPTAVERLDYHAIPGWTPDVPLVEMTHGSFKWAETDRKPTLSNISLKVKKGQVVAVVGMVGSGKSSLISAFLGDTIKMSGKVTLRGSVAYVPQQPWVMNATLRDNIVFGHRWDPAFYEQVLDACCLRSDIEMLSAGDQTEIGERGINLSGGQKARVSLARAIYARAAVYLLDDPLSAVDAHVGRHIFDHVIGPQGLLKNKARVLVTHGISYLRRTDHVVYLRDGQISEQGAYDDLMNKKTDLYKLITEYDTKVSNSSDESTDDATVSAEIEELPTVLGCNEEETSLNRETQLIRRERMNSVSSTGSSTSTLRRASLITLNRHRKHMLGDKERLMTIEERAKGSVDMEVYKQYAKTSSVVGVMLILMFQVLAQASQVGSNLWIKHWSSNNQQTGENNSVWLYLGIYAAIGWASTICTVLQTLILWIYCSIRSARILHAEMLDSVIRSPMSFFDTTPLGRILNRFSKDQHTVDEILPRTFSAYFRVFFFVVATIIIIAFSTPFFLLLIIPLGFVYIYVQRYYLATSRELKRLESIGKSPIYSHFQETISGVYTIRAYEQQNRFCYENEVRLDDNQRAYYPSISCNRWLAVRLEFMGSIIIFGAAIFAVVGVVYGPRSYIDAGLVGLSVSYALSVTQALNWVIRSYCEIETNIVSVERIKEYIELPREKYDAVRDVNPLWPDKGSIEFNGFGARYRPDMDLALRDITFKVKPREKIGIVGRTGAGKSSLSLSLFRIIEAAEGNIVIDGVDISSLRLFDLRSRLAIIPQDPVLFAGTVRDNLDPFGAYDDIKLWQALEHAHLKNYVAQMEGGLTAVVLEGGENFSVGQRQLICLARALLRRTTVLVLDEATAAIDVETDAIIQETIRRQFSHCTILTIAHRINTVLDSDRILVLDKGTLFEYDAPATLLSNKQSRFYDMAREAGLVN